MNRKIFLTLLLTAICLSGFSQEPAGGQSEEDHSAHQHPPLDSVAVVDTVRLRLDADDILSTTTSRPTIEGAIVPYDFEKKYIVEAIDRTNGRHTKFNVEYDGRFVGRLSAENGVNYLDFMLREKGKTEVIDVDSTRQIIFVSKAKPVAKQAIVWVDQFAAAKHLTVDSAVVGVVRQIRDAGFTAIALEAKSAEGFASYRRNERSGTPYLSATKNVLHQELTDDRLIVEIDTATLDTIKAEHFDLLGAFAGAADTLGLKFYAAFNFFTEGNITTRDTANIDGRQSWQSHLLATDGSESIAPLTQSARGREARDKGNRLQYLFTNPAADDVQQLELARVGEVLQNYPVDGVIIARCRYDGLDADFSDISRVKFEQFLGARGKSIKKFPTDILTFDSHSKVVEGELFADWIEFRAGVIAGFTARLRDVVDSLTTPDRSIELAAYVGNWYDKYYGYGVNWASGNFLYNDRLAFERPAIYTESYATTSFLRSLDFLIVGTFNSTLKRDVALAEVLTNGELPLAVALKMPDQMTSVVMLHAVEASGAGIVLLDLHRIGQIEKTTEMIEGTPLQMSEESKKEAAKVTKIKKTKEKKTKEKKTKEKKK